jgi:molecular chaperone DnaK (HSP70)
MLIDARNEADTVATATERALGQGTGLVPADEAERIRAAAAELRAIRDSDDLDAIRAATERLDQATRHLAEALMDTTLRETLKNRRVTEAPRR